MSRIELVDLRKEYGNVVAVKAMDLTIEDGEFIWKSQFCCLDLFEFILNFVEFRLVSTQLFHFVEPRHIWKIFFYF